MLKSAHGVGGSLAYGVVRTDSHHWDGGGGRTDLHDMFGLLWAGVLRANGVASSNVAGEEGWCGAPEIYARTLFFAQQPAPAGAGITPATSLARLVAHTAWASHALCDAVELCHPEAVPPKWQWQKTPGWLDRIRDLLPIDDGLYVKRNNPNWEYFVDGENRISIAKLGPRSTVPLRRCFGYYKPEAAAVGNDHAITAGGISNYLAADTVATALALLKRIEGKSCLPWHGADATARHRAILAVPVESHTLFIGARTIVAVAGPAGYYEFSRARELWKEQSSHQARVFQAHVKWTWAAKLDPARFEALACALLDRESGLKWVRPAGQPYERDAGRDLVARWLTPPGFSEPLTGSSKHEPNRVRTVLVQVKTRKRTVGKADIRDVRDTLDRHAADGFFLVSHPGISGDLFNYLESLGRQGFWVSWWGPAEIEDRLRAHLDVAAQFRDLVTTAE